MLRKETVSERTLELLKSLMTDRVLQSFFLVGGTALSLQLGHRMSIDLDLFTTVPFEEEDVLTHLQEIYSFQLDSRGKNTLKGAIEGIKVDLLSHQYPLVNELIFEEGVRMAAPADIAAMKLNAISVNGSRLKDFIDIAYLSNIFSLTEMVEAYETKYSSNNPAMVVKSLDYHNDINFEEPLQIMNGSFDWRNIEKRLSEMTLEPARVFDASLI